MSFVRRTRVVTRPAVSTARRVARLPKRDYYAEVCEDLQLIAALDEKMDQLLRERTEIETTIQSLMIEGKLQEVDDGTWSATYKASPGRASSEVDLQKFRKYVGDAKFFSVVKVNVTDAKGLVAEKEWAKSGISTTEGKPGDHKLTISRKKKK